MSNKLKTSPIRPYLLRAYHEWMTDNNITPLILVDANYHGVEVPVEHIKNGSIVLNISERATGNLVIQNKYVSFQARFNGAVRDIYIPMGAIMALYSMEDDTGLKFEPEVFNDFDDEVEPPTSNEPPLKKEKKSFLKFL